MSCYELLNTIVIVMNEIRLRYLRLCAALCSSSLNFISAASSNIINLYWLQSIDGRAMIELQVDVELKDTIVVAMPKLVGEGFYMCTIRVEYEWKPLRCSSYKVFGHVIDECYKNIISDVEKNLKNPKRFARGVHVGLKVYYYYSTITTPIVGRIDKIERQIIDGKFTLVAADGKSLSKVASLTNVGNECEVDDVVDDHAVFMASTS
nr:hypothetical protein [Tanacetum cinerariifolium]